MVADHELWVLVVAAPFLLFPNRWTPLVFVLIPLTWLCRVVAFGRFTIRTNMDVPMAILMIMAVVAYAISVDPATSRVTFWGIVVELAIFYGMLNGLRNERHILRMAGVLLLFIIGVALASLVATNWDAVRLVDLPMIYDRLPRLIRGVSGSGGRGAGDLVNPRKVGATLSMVLPIPVALLIFGRHRGLRYLSAGALLVGGVVLLLSQSLQGLLGLGMALLLLAVWRSRWFLLVIPVGLLALAVGITAYGPERLALALLSLHHPLGIAVALRLDMWSRAAAMIRDLPYTGIGLSTFPTIQTHFYTGFTLGPEPHAHNLFIQTALDLGLPGLVALIWLLVAFYATTVRAYRATTSQDLRALLAGLAAGALANVGHGLPDTLSLGYKGVAALFAMLGLAAAIERLPATDDGLALEGDASVSDSARPAVLGIRREYWAVVAALLILAISPLVVPAAPYMNLGAIRAHRALLMARATGAPSEDDLQAAVDPLRRALAREPNNAQVHGLLGSLYAWQGNYAEAIDSLGHRAALDGQDPMGRYAPFEALARRIRGDVGHDRWDDTLRVYTHWKNRFPLRAESYAQAAMVWQEHRGDRERAVAMLSSGLDKGAEPEGLLSYYLSELEE